MTTYTIYYWLEWNMLFPSILHTFTSAVLYGSVDRNTPRHTIAEKVADQFHSAIRHVIGIWWIYKTTKMYTLFCLMLTRFRWPTRRGKHRTHFRKSLKCNNGQTNTLSFCQWNYSILNTNKCARAHFPIIIFSVLFVSHNLVMWSFFWNRNES